MNEKGEQFYDFVKAQGINVPNSYDEFKTAMQDANTASQFHAFVIDKNISVPESVEEFQSTFSDGGADVNFTEGSVEQQEQPTEPLEQDITIEDGTIKTPEMDFNAQALLDKKLSEKYSGPKLTFAEGEPFVEEPIDISIPEKKDIVKGKTYTPSETIAEKQKEIVDLNKEIDKIPEFKYTRMAGDPQIIRATKTETDLYNKRRDLIKLKNQKEKQLIDSKNSNDDILSAESGSSYFLDGKELTRSQLKNFATGMEFTTGLESGDKDFDIKVENDGQMDDFLLSQKEAADVGFFEKSARGFASTTKDILINGIDVRFAESQQLLADIGLIDEEAAAMTTVLGSYQPESANKAFALAKMEVERDPREKKDFGDAFLRNYSAQIQNTTEELRGKQLERSYDVIDLLEAGEIGAASKEVAKMSVESLPYTFVAMTGWGGSALIANSVQAREYYDLRNQGVSKEKALTSSGLAALIETADAALESKIFKSNISKARNITNQTGMAAGYTKQQLKDLSKNVFSSYVKEMPTELAQGTLGELNRQWATDKPIDFESASRAGVIESLAAGPTSTIISSPAMAKLVYAPVKRYKDLSKIQNTIGDFLFRSVETIDDTERKILLDQSKMLVNDFVAESNKIEQTAKKATEEESNILKDLTLQEFTLERTLENTDNLSPETVEVLQSKLDNIGNQKSELINNIDSREDVAVEDVAAPEEVIEEQEYTKFVDEGVASEERIQDIADKVRQQQELTPREQEIFTDKTSEVNQKIEEFTPTEDVATVEEAEVETYTLPETLEERKQDFDIIDNRGGKADLEIEEDGKTGRWYVENNKTGRIVAVETKAEAQAELKEPVWDYGEGEPIITEDAAPVTEAVEEDVTLDDISKKYEDVTLDVFEKENVLSLDKIIVPEGNRGEGIGSSVMQDLIDYADKNNLKIILTPSKDFGATSVTRLKKFYKQFGFIDNKGKNRDFSHKESMYRNPEEVVSKTEEVVEEVPKEAPIVTDDAGKAITVYRGGKPASGVQFYTDDQKLAEDIGKAKDEGVQKATVRMENPWTPESLDVNNAPQWMKDWVRSREEFTTVDEETMAAEEIPMEQAIQEIKDMRLSFRDVSLWQSFVNETLKHHDGIIAFDPSEDMATDKKIYITKSPEQVVTEEVTEEVTEDTTKGKKEITEVKSGTHTSSNPIKIFKGLAGKQDLSGARINAHEGAKGVFTAVDEDLANEYAKDKGMSETILPAGTTFEVVEIDGTGMTPGQYRAAEVKAINDSKADVVKLITVDGRIKAGTKKQEQYIVKNEELIKEVRKPTKEPVKKDVNAEVRTLNDNFVEDEKGFFGKKRRPIGDIVSFAKKNNISEEALTMFLKDKKYSEKQIESAISTLNQEIDMSAKVVTWLPDFANKALEKAYEQIGDKYYRLLKLQKQTSAKTNRILSEEVDAYLATELETSKIAESINKFKNRIIKSKRKQDPALIERMSKDNISVESLGLYMYAMHATERNEFLKQRAIDEGKEGNLEGLSGMTNEQAQEILDSIPTNTKEKLGEYASEFRKEVIIKRIDNLKDSGLINDETADRLKNTYKNYVPLKVEEFESTKTATTAPRKIGVKGNVIWKAKGSNFFDAQSRRNPVIESINAYIQDDIKSERNRTFQTLMGLTREIDDKNILEIYRPRYQEMTDGLGNKVFIPLHKEPPNQSISGNVDGKVVYIIAKDKDLFKSLNNVPQGNYSTAVKVLQGVNSYLRNVNTLLNPEFIATNFARDIQTALINISAEDARKMSLQMIKNIPNAAKGIFQNEKGVESKWSKIYQELKDNGGDISWLDINSVDKIQKEVVKAEKAYRKNPTQSKLKDLMMIMGGFFTSTIKASEMATRLAAYQAAIENNYPPKKAASLAKNLTVNFEKKGFAGNIINTFYLFANAGLQGSFRIFKALGKKGRGGNRARAIVTGIIATSFLNAMLNELNDDEDELELLTDSDRDRKMVWKLSDGGSITIPLPYGYNVFWALGQNMYRYVSEKTNASQFMAATISSVNGAFNPFSSAIDDDAGAALIQSITPTAVKPIVEIGMNKNWNAAPIKPEQPPFGPKKKESELYFSTVRKPSRKVTEFLSELGVAEISPEIIDYTVDFVGGGLGRFITNSGELIYDVATGEDVPEYRIPFYRQFYMKPNERNIIPFIYEINANREIQDFTEREEKLYKKYLLKAFKDGLIDNSKYNRMRSDFDEAKYKRKAAKKDSFFD